jgi:hypothetical protein
MHHCEVERLEALVQSLCIDSPRGFQGKMKKVRHVRSCLRNEKMVWWWWGGFDKRDKLYKEGKKKLGSNIVRIDRVSALN